jgi:hypothetical protein
VKSVLLAVALLVLVIGLPNAEDLKRLGIDDASAIGTTIRPPFRSRRVNDRRRGL